ncbi:MAG: tRNA (adenosine(37)-N6)-threonylcarbamoyltransferase complex transferase subunit TsaD [Dehalococcoidales bacterium]|nr:tRNA (adenosine(37)-N6)-threonylcarbamoyltransferase complex transferase subunit TsaD [Dehalococcoidales bacterium]
MKILGIETSCDETAAAVVEDGRKVLSNQVASQVEIHARYGGIVPEVASRQHILSIIPVIKEAMEDAGTDWPDIACIAVTCGPGLAGSLLIGVNTAKALAMSKRIPLLGVNHLEGHIYANWISATDFEPEFPLLALIVSGGHSDLVLMKDHGVYEVIGRTRDDAPGEAFDKAARILELGYPGGPAIQKASEQGIPLMKLPRAWIKDTNDFSFSGIKTALLRLYENDGITDINDAAASFQDAIAEVLVTKTITAAEECGVRQIILAGGVAANRALRERLVKESVLPVFVPDLKYCTDNAAMIAACGYFRFKAGQESDLSLDVLPGFKLA